jgi:hypothetical protein
VSVDSLECLAEKYGGVGVFPLRIGRREKRAYVGAGNCAEQGVGDGVQKDVAIGVAAEAPVVRQSDASDF